MKLGTRTYLVRARCRIRYVYVGHLIHSGMANKKSSDSNLVSRETVETVQQPERQTFYYMDVPVPRDDKATSLSSDIPET